MIKLPVAAILAVGALFNPPSSDQWSATLQPSNGSAVSGSATVEGIGSADSTEVKISIKGAMPNATLSWHIHDGACGSAGAVFGSEPAYPKLRTTGTGTAEASVTLPNRPLKTKPYAVQVHRGTVSPAKPGSDVIACGDLKPVLNKMPTG